MKKPKLLKFIFALAAIMALSCTSVFAHCGGGRHHGYYNNGYYNNGYYNNTRNVNTFSCPYGNSICNNQGYCIDHSYSCPYGYAVCNNQGYCINHDYIFQQQLQQLQQQEQQQATQTAPMIVETQQPTTPNVAELTTTQPTQAYVCPYGNEICNQYGYCIGSCGAYGGCGRGCARYYYYN